MRELITKIKALPDIYFNLQDIQELSDFLYEHKVSLPLYTNDSFLKRLRTFKFSRQWLFATERDSQLDYVGKWLAMTNELLSWNNAIVTTWQELFPKKDLGNDDLLPITTELLPEDEEDLQSLAKKIDTAQKFARGETSFLLTNLEVAIDTKRRELAQKNIHVENNREVIRVVLEMRGKEFLREIKQTCNKYKKIVFHDIELQLKLQNKHTYDYYCNNVDEDTIFTELYENKNSFLILFNPDEKLNTLLEQYAVLKDMAYTAERSGTSAYLRSEEFIAKFMQHKNLLAKNVNINLEDFLSLQSSANNQSLLQLFKSIKAFKIAENIYSFFPTNLINLNYFIKLLETDKSNKSDNNIIKNEGSST